MGWFYTPSLYTAPVKGHGGESGAVSLPKMPFLPLHVEPIWKHAYMKAPPTFFKVEIPPSPERTSLLMCGFSFP